MFKIGDVIYLTEDVGNIEQTILEIFSKKYPEIIPEDFSTSSINVFDSLDLLEFIIEIEDDFGIEIPDVKIEGLTDINDLIYLVHNMVFNGEIE